VEYGDGRVDELAVAHVPQESRRCMPLRDGVVNGDGDLLARKSESKRGRAVVLADPHKLFAGPHTLEEGVLLREDVLQSEVDALGPTHRRSTH
jgi:hypothetical protein